MFLSLKRNFAYIATFIICLAVAFIIAWQAYLWQRSANLESFRHTSRENFMFIKKTLEWHEDFLLNISNFFLASETITPDEFIQFTDQNIQSPNGFHLLGWAAENSAGKYAIEHLNIQKGYAYKPIADIEKNPLFIHYLETAKLNGKPSYFIDKNLISIADHDHILIISPTFSDKAKPETFTGFVFTTIDAQNLILKSLGELNPYIALIIHAIPSRQDGSVLYTSSLLQSNNAFYRRQILLTLPELTFVFKFGVTDAFLNEYGTSKIYILFASVYLGLCLLSILYFRQLNSHIQKIRDAQKKAEESNRLKNDFLATMSHEIRSPMSGVLGMAELLLTTNLSTDQKGYTETILNSGEVLLNIIEDILDVSKIEANKMTIDPVPVNMVDIVDDVCALYTSRTQENAVEIAVRYMPGTPQFVYADPVRVRQVLGNLINNAVKFTPKGHIIITVEELREPDIPPDKTYLAFSVQDTGIGIEQGSLDRIFDQFTQADSSTTRNYGGTGLGLTICKNLVELMGGHISVASEPGKGSRFTFNLSLRRNEGEHAPEPYPPILKDVRVLIVDDFDVIGHTLNDSLSAIDMKTRWVPNPMDAISLMKSARERQEPFDIAIIDFLMPGMNGEKLAQAIKSDPDLADTCLVMLTAAGNPSTENILLKKYFSAYLAKPIRVAPFIEKLAVIWGMYQKGYRDTLIKTDNFPLVPHGKENYISLPGVSILLAEDSRINQAFALDVLEKMGCHVQVVTNGEEALHALRTDKFDLVLMDCQMPVMDGFEASRHITQMKKQGFIPTDLPIIALTANAMEGDREKCLAAGMNDYLSKPVRAKNLREKIYQWLDIDDYIIPTQGDPSANIRAQTDKDIIVDKESIQAAQNILKDKYDDIVSFFFEDTQSYIDEISNAFKNHNFNEGIRPAHTIKSTSLRMGAIKLSHCAADLEQLLKTHENDNFQGLDPQNLDGYLTHLRLILDQTRPLLSQINTA